MQRSEFEIMAPVGSWESLRAAIKAGADAVYFGIQGLNMRSRAAVNFTIDDLAAIAAECSAASVKTYLTVNTIMYDANLPTMRNIVDAAKSADISAIIAADISAILYARSQGVEVHISTQANISNIEAARFYSQWADTVVLARELNLEQVRGIYDAIQSEPILGPGDKELKIEMFCHGALCMAVSGKCYLSLHERNTSANRGGCAQICRRGYTVTDNETGAELAIDDQYIMSPKDLKTIHFLDRMVEAGVRVFKIEGRARGAEYVAEAVGCYDEAIWAICDGTFGEEKVNAWDQRLAKIFNRGFWDGYYLGQRLGEWSGHYGSSATRTKRYAAKCTKYFSKLGVGEFLLEAGEVSIGDEVVIIGPTTGALIVNVEEIHLDSGATDKARKGDVFAIKVPEKVRLSDRLYVWEETHK
ncbi:MAG: U32 family peptidase [Bacteroides sp.]|nr:U32 family peptidase [Bacteroides sp.]MCM1379014.1 U32 family peptidase [Bacteroides sp.]MCM1445630.1 U32 family peptidase [Prevotella sp.]